MLRAFKITDYVLNFREREMFKNLQVHYSQDRQTQTEWEVGALCVTESDNVYARGKISKSIGNDYSVYLVDQVLLINPLTPQLWFYFEVKTIIYYTMYFLHRLNTSQFQWIRFISTISILRDTNRPRSSAIWLTFVLREILAIGAFRQSKLYRYILTLKQFEKHFYVLLSQLRKNDIFRKYSINIIDYMQL